MNSNKNKIKTEAFFNNRAAKYNQVSRWTLNKGLNSMSLEMISNIEFNNIIDIGAGTGVLLMNIKKDVPKVAFDISQEMLNVIDDVNIEKIQGDAHKMPFPDESFDLVISRQMLHYCDVTTVFKNVKGILVNKGFFHIVQVVDIPNVPDEWDHKWTNLRKVENRKHLRKLEIQECINEFEFTELNYQEILLRNTYSWPEFYSKHRISPSDQKRTFNFFKNANDTVRNAIELELDENKISYNRLFGLWLLQK